MSNEIEKSEPVELTPIPTKRHPIQPLEYDDHGVLRYKKNQIVRDLLDVASKHGLDLNQIAVKGYSRDDQTQLTQLIGYSHSGASGFLPVSVSDAAIRMFEEGVTEEQARILNLEEQLKGLRQAMVAPVALLYSVHPDDITDLMEDTGDAD